MGKIPKWYLSVEENIAKIEKSVAKIERFQKITIEYVKQGKTKLQQKFPNESELQSLANTTKTCTKFKYADCTKCELNMLQKNKCWKLAKKKTLSFNLIKKLPLNKDQLSNLKRIELVILCKHFEINTWALSNKQTGNLVAILYQAQIDKGMIKKNEFEHIVPYKELTNKK